jgi:CRP-like cAMP-binding protein
VDLQNALLALADHNIQAVGPVKAAFISISAIGELIAACPSVARAMWIETLLDASIQREWIVNVGRRDARARIAHLFCELGLRQESAGLANRDVYDLPLTQEQLADATGLTTVHVNRVVQGLRSEGVIQGGHKGAPLRCEWARMAKIGDFRSNYLGILRGR